MYSQICWTSVYRDLDSWPKGSNVDVTRCLNIRVIIIHCVIISINKRGHVETQTHIHLSMRVTHIAFVRTCVCCPPKIAHVRVLCACVLLYLCVSSTHLSVTIGIHTYSIVWHVTHLATHLLSHSLKATSNLLRFGNAYSITTYQSPCFTAAFAPLLS